MANDCTQQVNISFFFFISKILKFFVIFELSRKNKDSNRHKEAPQIGSVVLVSNCDFEVVLKSNCGFKNILSNFAFVQLNCTQIEK